MQSSICRWGIMGAANIARKNWKAIRNAGNASLVAVASRDQSRAQLFIDECFADTPLPAAPVPCSYEDLLKRSDIDAVYIPLPTGIRPEWVIRAAQSGKHVLSEKPCGSTAADVRAMIDACRQYHVQFMDGVMFMHSRRLDVLRRTLDDGESVGDIRRITSQFSFLGADEFLKQNICVSQELEPLGCLGDLGWYNVRFTLWALGYQMPERVSGRILSAHGRGDSSSAVPTEFSAELYYPGGVSASFYCSFRTENHQWANVAGTKGYLHVPDFVLPFFGAENAFEVHHNVFRNHGCDFNMERHTKRHTVREYSNSTADSQETKMIREFSRIAKSGKLEPIWGEIALKTQQVVDACMRSAREDGKLATV